MRGLFLSASELVASGKEPTTEQLPTPQQVRAEAARQQPGRAWPPLPVLFSDQNLLVKYGGLTSEHEYLCLKMIRTRLGSQVPVPKPYGCCQDGGEVFIYMELIRGRTLEQRWDQLSEEDRTAICSQLRPMIAALRTIKQSPGEEFIGSITRGKLLDRIFEGLHVGPFESTSALNDFFTQRNWGQPPKQPPEDLYEMRSGLPDDAITFTHSDLHRSNIMVTAEGQPPRVLAIIDWQQSGWYPAYWEYCKARWTIVLIRYTRRLFKDHWAIFVPSASSQDVGTLIQVEGDVRAGFAHDMKRNYDIRNTRRNFHIDVIGTVEDRHVHSTPSSGELVRDARDAKDDIERAALSIPAPGPSMRPTQGNAPPTQRAVFSDCQWWVRQVVAKLVQDGILPQESLATLDAIPKN
ncbi:hypothetical protein DV735_g3284, partial [Chaetothyriales sp. CBS 134920]